MQYKLFFHFFVIIKNWFFSQYLKKTVIVSHSQTYYYNARTRESSWSKPDGVKVIQQSELNPLLVAGAAGSGANVGVTASSSSVNTTASTAAASPTQAPSSAPSRTLTSSPDSITTHSPSASIAGKQHLINISYSHTHKARIKPKVLLFLPKSHRCSRPPSYCHSDLICCCFSGHCGDCFHGAISCYGSADRATAASSPASQCGPAHRSHTCLPSCHGATFQGAFARHAYPSTRWEWDTKTFSQALHVYTVMTILPHWAMFLNVLSTMACCCCCKAVFYSPGGFFVSKVF